MPTESMPVVDAVNEEMPAVDVVVEMSNDNSALSVDEIIFKKQKNVKLMNKNVKLRSWNLKLHQWKSN